MDPKQILAKLYEAFARGDVATILAHVAPDCQWEYWPDNHAQKAGVNWMQPRRGPEEVAGFFQILSTYKFHKFEVQAILGNEQHAIGMISLSLEVPGKGTINDEELHLFTFNSEGKVIAFRHYMDTAKAIAVYAA